MLQQYFQSYQYQYHACAAATYQYGWMSAVVHRFYSFMSELRLVLRPHVLRERIHLLADLLFGSATYGISAHAQHYTESYGCDEY